MSNRFTPRPHLNWLRWTERLGATVLLTLLSLGFAGCHTPDPPMALLASQARSSNSSPESVRINPGDLIQITFPGAPKMDTTERVRVDGHLLMPLVGEVQAAGKTPLELQNDLVKLYANELQVKQVLVILASSTASVFVTGAVGRPGRIAMERPLTALDAIMEAGGFNAKSANVKKISVIRQRNGHYQKYMLDLRPVLKGKDVPPFPLEPFDIIYVPEKIF
jgi:polysaccharide export outer membrane protein